MFWRDFAEKMSSGYGHNGPPANSNPTYPGSPSLNSAAIISEACHALSEASSLLRQAISGELEGTPLRSTVPPSSQSSPRVVEARRISTPPTHVLSPSPSTSTPTPTSSSVTRPSEIRSELTRCFRTRSRTRQRRPATLPASRFRSRPTWPHIWVALAVPGQDWVPTLQERRELVKAGLGEKKLLMPVKLNFLEVVDFLIQAYPKM